MLSKPLIPSLSYIADEWIQTLPNIKQSTRNKYRNILSSYILPALGEYNYSDISQEILDSVIDQIQHTPGKKGHHLSSKTLKEIINILKRILNYAEAQGYIIHYHIKPMASSTEKKELVIFSKEQERKLFTYLCAHIDDDKNLGILLSLFTGMRIGEVCALKWEDISLTDKTLHISKTMQRIQISENEYGIKTQIIITSPKSACSNRTIPLPEPLVSILQEHKKCDSTYVLSGSETKIIEPRLLQYHYKRQLYLAKINYINFHALRHTFATRCIEVGFDMKSLSEILGHSSTTITMNRYVHPSIDLKRQNMNKLNELFTVK